MWSRAPHTAHTARRRLTSRPLSVRSPGVLSELHGHTEPLSLSSSMKAMVQYTRQALHWLRLDAQSPK